VPARLHQAEEEKTSTLAGKKEASTQPSKGIS